MSDEAPPPYSFEWGHGNGGSNLTENTAPAHNEVIDLEDAEDDELDDEDDNRVLSSGEELDQLVEEMYGMSNYLAFSFAI
jgi:hypothetical protein